MILRLLAAVVFTMATVIFSMANTHQVQLDYVFGPPAQVRLIFLLMMSFAVGVLVANFLSLLKRIRLRTRLRAAIEYAPESKKARKTN